MANAASRNSIAGAGPSVNESCPFVHGVDSSLQLELLDNGAPTSGFRTSEALVKRNTELLERAFAQLPSAGFDYVDFFAHLVEVSRQRSMLAPASRLTALEVC
jgi:hypothetical protein